MKYFQDNLASMARKMRLILIMFAFTIIIFSLYIFFNSGKTSNGVLRVKGIVVEDSLGRDRILIGSPLPSSRNRVRTDSALVRKYWAKRFKSPDEYMRWYKGYKNDADGIAILNEDGFDRVLLGDRLADPNTGKRLFESAGFLVNDRHGWEKIGAGVNTTRDGQSRSAFGLDDKDGEAVHLMALEDGSKGLVISGKNGRMVIGMAGTEASWFNRIKDFTGIQFFSNEGKLIFKHDLKK